jgi:hypothetical protein
MTGKIYSFSSNLYAGKCCVIFLKWNMGGEKCVVNLNLSAKYISVSLNALRSDICKKYYMQIFVVGFAARVARKIERRGKGGRDM